MIQKNWKEDFKSLYKERGQQRYGIRLLALWKMQEGLTTKQVSIFIGKTEKTIRKWCRLYESGGVESLMSISSGRGLKVKIKERELLKEEIENLQKNKTGGRIKCGDIVRFVEEKFNINYSNSGMYKLLKRLGFVWITSRSRHPKSNPEQQLEFKKNSKRKSERSSQKG
jgi:transposase